MLNNIPSDNTVEGVRFVRTDVTGQNMFINLGAHPFQERLSENKGSSSSFFPVSGPVALSDAPPTDSSPLSYLIGASIFLIFVLVIAVVLST